MLGSLTRKELLNGVHGALDVDLLDGPVGTLEEHRGEPLHLRAEGLNTILLLRLNGLDEELLTTDIHCALRRLHLRCYCFAMGAPVGVDEGEGAVGRATRDEPLDGLARGEIPDEETDDGDDCNGLEVLAGEVGETTDIRHGELHCYSGRIGQKRLGCAAQ